MAKILGAAALGLLCVSGCEKAPPATAAPAKVEVVTITLRDVPIYHQWIGTLDGYPNAQIRAQVTGYLIKQDYKEGGTVKQGDLLFEIDPRPFQAVVDQALAKLDQDQAMLGKTELDVKRYTPLAKSQAVSQEQLDDAVQANLGAKAAIVADNAAIETAKLNLGFTKITSPVDGVAGLALAQVGDLVGPGSGALTTVSTVNPIRAYFNITEQFYLTFPRKAGLDGTDARLEDIPLQLILSDGSTYPQPGKWTITGRQVDVNTGALQVAGVFDNPGNFLRPGQYALIRAKTEMRKGALLVPQRAVTELQGAFQVGVVNSENVVSNRTVRVGDQIGADWLIESGLHPNDRVVVEGAQKTVKDGTKVETEPFNAAQSNAASGASAGGPSSKGGEK